MKQPKGGPLERADDILRKIRTLRAGIDALRINAEIEMQEIRDRHQQELGPLLEKLTNFESEIMALMKKEKTAIFEERERTELKYGILLYLKDFKLSIPRKASEKIIAQGWPLRIAISINKRAIEFWPDEWLRDMGIVRKPVENFSYETLPYKESEGR